MSETVTIRGKQYFVSCTNKPEGRYGFRPLVTMVAVETNKILYRKAR